MTIQLSVLLWTIICFCLLMLILSKMLFGPLLKVMDARQEKIDRAREKQKADALALDQAQKAVEAAKCDIAARGAELSATQVAEARAQAEAAVAQAKLQSQKDIEAYAQALQQEAREIKTKMDTQVDSLATVFADRLVS